MARINAVLRRRSSPTRSTSLTFDGLSLDEATRTLTVRGKVVATTAKEFDLLAFLASSQSQVFSRDQLLDGVWGSSSELSTTIGRPLRRRRLSRRARR